MASANCAVGRELQLLYEQDLIGQADADLLATLQKQVSATRAAYEFLGGFIDGQSASRPPASPPPPRPPPASLNAPPAAPAFQTLDQKYAQLQTQLATLEAQLETARATVEVCVPSASNICGRSKVLAPDPWLSRDGQKCAGHDTMEGLEGSFCGYWGSEVRDRLYVCDVPVLSTDAPRVHTCPQRNPDAADSAEAAELLSEDGAPYCFSPEGAALKCPVTADRTIRSGTYELEVRRLGHAPVYGPC